jgi:hypothetical protein
VIIRSDQSSIQMPAYGVSVTLAHLKKASLKVKLGDYVQAGASLAKIGNSGYSQEPHLHMQAQISPLVGAPTTPFHLLNYGTQDEIDFHDVPAKGTIIESLPLNQALEKTLNFRVDQTLHFDIQGRVVSQEACSIETHVDETTGEFYLWDGISRLNFSRIGVQFYFYQLQGKGPSPLWDLFVCAPKIPLTFGDKKSFHDDLPFFVTTSPHWRWLTFLINIFRGRRAYLERKNSAFYQISATGLEISGEARIQGQLQQTFIRFDPVSGIQEFKVGERRYVRKD